MRVIETSEGLACWLPDEVVVLNSPFQTIASFLSEHQTLSAIDRYPVRARRPLADISYARPGVGAVWGVGLNYRSKAALTGRELPSEPILYLAAPAAVVASHTPVVPPATQTSEMDCEGEIGILIGAPLYQASAEEVWPAMAGITAANDMSARDVMRRTKMPTLAKSFPGFKPLGPSYASLDELRDRDCIRLRTFVNGEPWQDDTSAAMIFPVPELISRLSWFVALHPGDLVLTGTPAGTGQDRQIFLKPGDEVRVEVDAVLPLVTTIAPSAAPSIAPSADPSWLPATAE